MRSACICWQPITYLYITSDVDIIILFGCASVYHTSMHAPAIATYTICYYMWYIATIDKGLHVKFGRIGCVESDCTGRVVLHTGQVLEAEFERTLLMQL